MPKTFYLFLLGWLFVAVTFASFVKHFLQIRTRILFRNKPFVLSSRLTNEVFSVFSYTYVSIIHIYLALVIGIVNLHYQQVAHPTIWMEGKEKNRITPFRISKNLSEFLAMEIKKLISTNHAYPIFFKTSILLYHLVPKDALIIRPRVWLI